MALDRRARAVERVVDYGRYAAERVVGAVVRLPASARAGGARDRAEVLDHAVSDGAQLVFRLTIQRERVGYLVNLCGRDEHLADLDALHVRQQLVRHPDCHAR